MIINISVHHPKPGAEPALIESMHRYGAAIKGAPGLVGVYTLQDKAAGVLVGMAIWESQAAKDASAHLAWEAVANDPFDQWEAEDVGGYALTEV